MTTHTTTSLTAFLLARYDDAEAEVQHWPSDGPWGLHPSGRMWTDAHGHPIYAPRARVLAEVKAHRAIVEVEILRACDNVPRSGFVSEEVADAIRSRADTKVLRILASIHSAHPDYDESWRP